MSPLKISALATLLFITSTGCETPSGVGAGVYYANPAWAPPYSHGVRYYYLPDIEVYYDLADEEFIYLQNGQWFFSPVLPPIYNAYDLYGGFVVVLDGSVFQPWRHHHYYVSHYPRYYHQNVYRNRNYNGVRGFNENDRKPIYPGANPPQPRAGTRPARPTAKQPVAKPPQQPNYYGKKIGQPVKVRPQMKADAPDIKSGARPKKR